MEILVNDIFSIYLYKNMKVGDIVEYVDDWKPGRKWYLYDVYGDSLCMIVLIRDGSYENTKNGETRLNASIVNLNMDKIKILK